MPIPLLESASTCVFFSLLSLVPLLLKTCAPSKVSSIPLSERPALPMVLQRMTMSGANAWKKQSTWQLGIRCAHSLSPFSRSVTLLIQEHCGTPFGRTSVMTSSAILSFMEEMLSHQRKRYRIMVFISLTNFFLRLGRGFNIGTLCHKSQEIGAPSFRISTPLLQSRETMTQRSRLTLLNSTLPISILISTLPLTRSLLLSPTQQERSFSFMVLEVQAKPISTIPFAITCAHRGRLFSVLLPLALLPFSSRVVALFIHVSRSLFPVMSLPYAPSPKTPHLLP